MFYAADVLTRYTNGTDRYSHPAVATVIDKRIRDRPDAKFRIKPPWKV